MTSNKPIFLVDDSSDVREIFKMVAGLESMPIVTAENGLEGIDKLQSLSSEPAIIFVDLVMPIMDGREFLKQIKERGLALSSRIIVLSGAPPDSNQNESGQEWVQKPVDLKTLQAILRDSHSKTTAH